MNPTVLSCENISLTLSGAKILNNVNLKLEKGKMHLLLGENGAGKTSLVKILSGVYPYGKYTGSIIYEGKPLTLFLPKDAIKHGIITIYQDTSLYEDLSVAENLFANLNIKEITKFTTKFQKQKLAANFFKKYNFDIDVSMPVGKCSIQQKRTVELLKLYLRTPGVLILDEPISVFSQIDIHFFIDIIRHFKKSGTAILCVSHNYLPFKSEVDSFSVLNNNYRFKTYDMSFVSDKNISDIVLRDFCYSRYPKISLEHGPEVFCAENLGSEGKFQNITFSLRKGEILGIFGRNNSGRDALSRALFGLIPITEGNIYVDRLPASISSPQDAIKLGLAYISDDRSSEGLFWNLSLLNNVYCLKSNRNDNFWVNYVKEKKQFINYSNRMDFFQDPGKNAELLSGGEQQKIMLMRWLLSSARIFIFNEPTQSIDIPSKIDIYNMFNDLLLKSCSIILFSSNLEELFGLCDRIIFISSGKVAGEIKEADFQNIDDSLKSLI